jgi:hypothetical protein
MIWTPVDNTSNLPVPMPWVNSSNQVVGWTNNLESVVLWARTFFWSLINNTQ